MNNAVQSPKVVAINVVVTFLEAFLPVWALSDHALTQVAVFSAGAAGISAAWNVVVKPFLKSRGILYNKVV